MRRNDVSKSELEQLLAALTKNSEARLPGEWIGGAEEMAASRPAARRTAPMSMEQLVASIVGRPAAPPREPEQRVTAGRTGDDGSNAALSVLKTVGKFTGISPVITGLFKLFGGGGGDDEGRAAPIPFEMPGRIAVEAGLLRDRSLGSVSYGELGSVRANPPAAAPVQITVQAIDSRSFLDHRDEIARAVREAMLNSHSLNDVVSEL